MNRLWALSAAGMLATGCVSSADTCDAHNVWIGWPSFVRASGSGYVTTSSCSGISQMDVYVDGSTTPISAYCSDDSVPVTLLTGSHYATVEALDGDGFPILRDEFDFPVSKSCADQLVDAQPGEGLVQVNYDFNGAQCTEGGSYIWFNIHDDIAGIDIAGADGSRNSAAYVCNASYLSPAFPLPAGNYTLKWMEEVYYQGGAYHVSGGYCSPTAFAVNSGHDTSTPVVHLADRTTACF